MPRLGHQWPHVSDESLGGPGGRLVLVDDAARGGFVGGRQSVHRLLDILVNERLKAVTLVRGQKRVQGEKQPRLLIIEIADEVRDAHGDQVLLPHRRGRRMRPGGGEIAAVCRAGNFRQAFTAAADCADELAEGGTGPSGLALTAQGTLHSDILLRHRLVGSLLSDRHLCPQKGCGPVALSLKAVLSWLHDEVEAGLSARFSQSP